MPKIFIIILNWNGKKDTLECLASVEKIDYASFHTLVVDNGSSDDSAHALRSAFPSITCIETGSNLGFAEGNNVGIRYALLQGADFIFLLNNDTVVDPQILHAFMAMSQNGGDILGGQAYLYTQPDVLDHLGGIWNPKRAQFDLIGHRATHCTARNLDYVCGCALFARRAVFETIGLLEPKFFLIWEESDFCMRATKANFSVQSCPEAKLLHKVSASFVGGKAHTTYFWWRNRLLWIERNCAPKDRLMLYIKVLIPEIAHIYKLNILKSLQLALLRLFSSEKWLDKQKRLLQYRAALQGIKDYLLRRFGNGPAWIYTNTSGNKKEQ